MMPAPMLIARMRAAMLGWPRRNHRKTVVEKRGGQRHRAPRHGQVVALDDRGGEQHAGREEADIGGQSLQFHRQHRPQILDQEGDGGGGVGALRHKRHSARGGSATAGKRPLRTTGQCPD
jgi:hypothetical protein